jgi:hypothetical protein
MVAACRYALLVKVLDVPHGPLASRKARFHETTRISLIFAYQLSSKPQATPCHGGGQRVADKGGE